MKSGPTTGYTPKVSLGEYENNLSSVNVNSAGGTKVHDCVVSNIPLQKWLNVIISVYGRSLDMYLDGKLVRTCYQDLQT